MTETFWCRACGTETSSAGRCPTCGTDGLAVMPLPPLAESAEEQGADAPIGFELVDWAAPERADLVAWLIASRIPHRLEGDAVYVDPSDESRTDAIIDWVTAPDGPSGERVPVEQIRSALVALRRACRSIEHDPGLIADPDLLSEIQEVLDLGVPQSWPVEAWYEVRLLTDRLVNEGADAPDANLVHWARRVAWLIRVHGDGTTASRLRPARAALPPPPAPAELPDGVAVDPDTAEGLLSWCPSCLFDGVAVIDRCPRCNEPLLKSTVPELPDSDPDDDEVLEVEYRLDEWDHDQRDRLIALLFDYAVSHRFEGDDSLIVAGASESLVDALVEEAAAPAELDAGGGVGGGGVGGGGGRGGGGRGGGGRGGGAMPAEPDVADALRRLLDAARTVARTPSAADEPEFTQAALDVLTMNTPFGIGRDQWEEAAQLTHSLLHGGPGDTASAANRAASLVRMISPWVNASVDLPIRDDKEQDELVYELGEWSAEQRALLTLALDIEGITYSWEKDTDLIVDNRDESRIDTLLDEAEGADEPDGGESAGGEDDYEAISTLFGICDRLAHRPGDKGLRTDAVAAATAVDGLSVPYGVADSDWWQLRARARELSGSLGSGAGSGADSGAEPADEDVIAEQAATLRELLRAFL